MAFVADLLIRRQTPNRSPMLAIVYYRAFYAHDASIIGWLSRHLTGEEGSGTEPGSRRVHEALTGTSARASVNAWGAIANDPTTWLAWRGAPTGGALGAMAVVPRVVGWGGKRIQVRGRHSETEWYR